MNFGKFVEEVKERLVEYFGSEYKIETSKVTKDNDIELEGVTISNGISNISPCIYLDDFYDRIFQGKMTMEELISEIIGIYYKHEIRDEFDISSITDFQKVRSKIRGKLVNANRNRKATENGPFREVLDLVLTYYIEISHDDFESVASTRVTNDLMKRWNVSEEDLYQQMQNNMQMEEGTIVNIIDVLKDMAGEILDDEIDPPMYVMTNKKKINGAVQILNDTMLKKAEKIAGENFYILPSSLHETLIIPANADKLSTDELVDMVELVNNNEVSASEILSYHVYYYSHETGKISIAA